MQREVLLDLQRKTFEECEAIMERKNRDYAGEEPDALANFKRVGALGLKSEDGILTRMTDKFMRIGNLLHGPPAVAEESLDDTVLDLINYTALLRAVLSERAGAVP